MKVFSYSEQSQKRTREIIGILMESTLYFELTLLERRRLIIDILHP